MAKIDILLPYWGDFSLLKEAVDSVLAQSESDWRLVVIDDCYPSDEAKHYFETQTDSRIEYVRHEQNIGITNNFNYCIDTASAEYCVMLGCDDRLLPHYVERALTSIGSADIYQPNVEVIDKNGTVYLPIIDRVKRILRPKRAGIYHGNRLATSLSRGQWLYFPSLMWRTSTLKKYRFDPTYKVVEDVVLIFSMVLDGATLQLDNTMTFQYRRFSESVSSKEKKNGSRFDEESSVYRQFATKFAAQGWRSASRAARLHLTSRLHRLASR